jgi:hypothetical protein
MDAILARERLPHAFHAIVPQLSADLEGVRFAAEQALKRLLQACLDDAAVSTAVTLARMEAGTVAGGPPSAAAAIVAAIAGGLDPRSQRAWPAALSGKAGRAWTHLCLFLAHPCIAFSQSLCAGLRYVRMPCLHSFDCSRGYAGVQCRESYSSVWGDEAHHWQMHWWSASGRSALWQ